MSGTDFPDSVKLEARRLAYFRCCYCHDRPGDDVHHLTPKEEGGLGNIDNDPDLEVITTFDNHQINAFNDDGTSVLASATFSGVSCVSSEWR